MSLLSRRFRLTAAKIVMFSFPLILCGFPQRGV